ncbi:cupin domain-containing protein [Chitinophagaceae bacterium LB-8]|uniref:Cupin domain-containing protein n=1 Tax=Paraflavisolibacter caeni TaxID=2982496 RepID=A0A9X3B9A4_9BACT|nr:cupin domain-containing protein [Paraflavisolibacter caeni]MCU7551870.1 cupin domain-containing protein [Paraflavisolibacter caeni]
MKKVPLIFTLVSSIFLFNSVHAQEHSTEAHIMVNSQNLAWNTGPASLPAGIQIAILEGDLTKAGPFTARLMIPANYRIGPHFHPAIEHVTVLEGSFYMGTGKEFNESTATELKPGDFAVMPKEFVHYAFSRDKVLIQLHGIGPWGITYINEADDPRKKQ